MSPYKSKYEGIPGTPGQKLIKAVFGWEDVGAVDEDAVWQVVEENLTEREARVLQLRFGHIPKETPSASDGRTLEEVAKEFNVLRERIRQIEAKALRKLRWPGWAKLLKEAIRKEEVNTKCHYQ